MASGDRIDLVILDLIMPDKNGREILDMIKKINPNAPVLLTSGYGLDDEALDFLESGCHGFFQKPFDINKMDERISEILNRRA